MTYLAHQHIHGELLGSHNDEQPHPSPFDLMLQLLTSQPTSSQGLWLMSKLP